MPVLRHRLALLLVAASLGGGAVAGCGDDATVDKRGDTPSGVGEPGNDASETGGGGAPAEGVDDKNKKD